MIGDKRISRKIRYRAYLEAVELSLERLYNINSKKAQEIAMGWWEKLSRTSALKSGIFLHVEPLQTAADLLGVKALTLEGSTLDEYSVILRESMTAARHLHLRKPPRMVALDLPFKEDVA